MEQSKRTEIIYNLLLNNDELYIKTENDVSNDFLNVYSTDIDCYDLHYGVFSRNCRSTYWWRPCLCTYNFNDKIFVRECGHYTYTRIDNNDHDALRKWASTKSILFIEDKNHKIIFCDDDLIKSFGYVRINHIIISEEKIWSFVERLAQLRRENEELERILKENNITKTKHS